MTGNALVFNLSGGGDKKGKIIINKMWLANTEKDVIPILNFVIQTWFNSFDACLDQDWAYYCRLTIFRNGSHAITSLEPSKYFAIICAIKKLSLAVDNKILRQASLLFVSTAKFYYFLY